MEPWKIRDVLFSQGISPKLKGFHYLIRTLSMMLSTRCADVDEAARVIRLVGGSNPRQVETCMRYAIHRAWDLEEGSIREEFPNLSYPPAVLEYLLVTQWRLEACCGEDREKVDKRIRGM